MGAHFFFTGLIMGFSIAAPVGPIGVLCMRRTLAEGRLCGLLSGLGAATADAMYGCVAGLGLTAVAAFLTSQQAWLRLVGGAFLCYLGLRTFFSRPAGQAARTRGKGLWGAYASTVFLTLTNPMTILSFAAIFSGLGLGGPGTGRATAALLVLGVFSGSAAWWLILSSATGLLRARLDPRALRWVNRVSGLAILGFGLWAVTSALLGWVSGPS